MYCLVRGVMKAYLSGKRETWNCPGGMFFGGEASFENCIFLHMNWESNFLKALRLYAVYMFDLS